MATWLAPQRGHGDNVDWAKTCNVWPDVALVTPAQDSFYGNPTTLAYAVRWTASGGTIGSPLMLPAGQTLEPSTSCRLVDGVAVVIYRADPPGSSIRVIAVDQTTLDVAVVAERAPTGSTMAAQGAWVARVSDTRFLVVHTPDSVPLLQLFEVTGSTIALLDELVLTATGPITYADGVAYSHEEQTVQRIAVGDTLASLGTWTITAPSGSDWDTWQGHEVLVDGNIHFLGHSAASPYPGHHLVIPIDETAQTVTPLGYSLFAWRDVRFHDNFNIEAAGGAVFGVAQDYPGEDVHFLTLTGGAFADELVPGGSDTPDTGEPMYQHELTALTASRFVITSVDNNLRVWVRCGSRAAVRRLAHNRIVQRGNDGLGVTGGRRIVGTRTLQSSNRATGIR